MNLLNFVFIIQTQLPGEAIPEGQNKHLPKCILLQKQHEHWQKWQSELLENSLS